MGSVMRRNTADGAEPPSTPPHLIRSQGTSPALAGSWGKVARSASRAGLGKEWKGRGKSRTMDSPSVGMSSVDMGDGWERVEKPANRVSMVLERDEEDDYLGGDIGISRLMNVEVSPLYVLEYILRADLV
jgi:hypothetical protein